MPRKGPFIFLWFATFCLLTSLDSPRRAVEVQEVVLTHTHTDTHSSLHNSCGTLLHFESLSVFLSRVRGSRQDHLLLVRIAVTEAVRRQVLRVCCRAALVYVSARVLWHGGRVHLLGSALAKPRFAGSFVWFSCPKTPLLLCPIDTVLKICRIQRKE